MIQNLRRRQPAISDKSKSAAAADGQNPAADFFRVKISQASDAPNAVGDVLQLESDLGRVNQVTSNLNLVSGQVNSAESALETATNLLDQVRVMAHAGREQHRHRRQPHHVFAAGRADPDFAGVSVSQTQFNGAYVFGGDQPTRAVLPSGSQQSERRGSLGDHANPRL